MLQLKQLRLLMLSMALALAEEIPKYKELQNTIQKDITGCGGVIKDIPEGIIDYPGKGRNYKNNQNCNWEITLQEGDRMEVNFLRFSTANNKDKLLVMNGKTYSIVGTFFGKKSLPPPFTTDSNQLLLRFTSDARITQKGFKLTWKKINVTVNQCEGRSGLNSLLWQRVDSAEDSIKTTINEGNYNVTDNVDKAMQKLKYDNSKTELELNSLKSLLDNLDKAMQTLTDDNSKTKLQLIDLKYNQEIAMKNISDGNSKLDFLISLLGKTTVPTTTDATTIVPTTTVATTTVPTTPVATTTVPTPTVATTTVPTTTVPTTKVTTTEDPTTELTTIDLLEVNFPTVGGTAKATSHWADPWIAVKGFAQPGHAWHSAQTTTFPQSIWYEFPQGIRVVKYSFQSRTDGYETQIIDRGPTRYVFWGSNAHDCTNIEARVTLVEDTSGTPFTQANIPKVEDVENPDSYRCYGFTIYATGGNTHAAMSNIRFYYPRGTCVTPWVSLGDSGCFQVVREEMEWSKGREYCQHIGADLAILDSESKRIDMYNYLQSIGMASTRYELWIGGNDFSGSWQWNNNVPVTGWERGQPDYTTRDSCVHIWIWSGSKTNYLADFYCYRKVFFVCEK